MYRKKPDSLDLDRWLTAVAGWGGKYVNIVDGFDANKLSYSYSNVRGSSILYYGEKH